MNNIINALFYINPFLPAPRTGWFFSMPFTASTSLGPNKKKSEYWIDWITGCTENRAWHLAAFAQRLRSFWPICQVFLRILSMNRQFRIISQSFQPKYGRKIIFRKMFLGFEILSFFLKIDLIWYAAVFGSKNPDNFKCYDSEFSKIVSIQRLNIIYMKHLRRESRKNASEISEVCRIGAVSSEDKVPGKKFFVSVSFNDPAITGQKFIQISMTLSVNTESRKFPIFWILDWRWIICAKGDEGSCSVDQN